MVFTATIEKTPGKGGWHYVRIPDNVRVELRDMSGKSGNVPVLVTIGKSTWSSTTMSMGEQRWFVAVKADIRKTENVSEGDTVSVRIAPDIERIK
jgi:translation initiation factor IF-1